MPQIALVTGAAKRIGAAIIKRLHQKNFNVIIHYNQSVNAAKALAKNLNAQRKDSAIIIHKNLNLAGLADAKEFIATVYAWHRRLDLVVNNASVFYANHILPTHENYIDGYNPGDWQALFTINVTAPFLLSLAAFPYLRKQRGVIINLTDIHSVQPLRHYSIYCQTKAALVMQTKALAREFAPLVRVNAIAPGNIMWPEGEHKLNLAAKKNILAKIPLQHIGKPENIADALLTLVSNCYITGQVLTVDGGRSIGS